jgi:hypothetical protein
MIMIMIMTMMTITTTKFANIKSVNSWTAEHDGNGVVITTLYHPTAEGE